MTYSVLGVSGGFKLQAYPTGRTSSVLESIQTWTVRETAEAAATMANKGFLNGITFGLFADD